MGAVATPRIQSVDRAFSLLSQLALNGGCQSLPSMAAECGLSVATAHRLLATLETLGVIVHTAPGEYRLGMGLVDLARTAAPDKLLAAAAEPALRRIIQTLGHTAHVGMLDDDYMVTYIAKMARKSHRMPTQIGSQLEAYCSGLGKVLLSALPCPERSAYIAEGPFVPLTVNTITEAAHLARELEQVRRQGYAIDDCEIFDDLRCVAVPITGRNGKVVAALSTSAPASVFAPADLPDIARALAERAREISLKLYPAASTARRAH